MEAVALRANGSHLHGVLHAPDEPRAVALLVHGFNSCSREFDPLPERLAKGGLAAYAIDLRGHGASGGERGAIGLEAATQDIDAAVAYLKKRFPDLPRMLIGHSLGAAYAIGYAARHRQFESLVVAHPVDRIFDELNLVEKAFYHVIGRIGRRRQARGKHPGTLPRPDAYRNLFVDRKAAAEAKRDGFLQGRVHVGGYTFATTMQASDWARRVKLPVLGIVSPHDKIVKPSHSDHVLDSLAGPVQRLHHEGGHSCWRDKDGDKIAQAILAFMEAQ